jgi:iron complex outermembrane receptor protein
MGSEDEFLENLPIILSATRLAQPLNESPIAMTVIDRQMIDASGARNIADLLRLAPGFQVGYFDGNSPVVTYHGLGSEHSRRVQVLIDGRSVYVPTLAAIQWSNLIIGIEEIERIEVIRGPNAATYGNNSFLAVISITTRQAIEDQGHKIKLIHGSQDSIDTLYRFSGQAESVDYRITIGTQKNNGTDLLNDYTDATYLSYRLDYQLDVNNYISYQGGYKDLKLGDHESPPDFQTEAGTAFQLIKWEHNSHNGNTLTLQYYYNYNNEDISHENKVIQFDPPFDFIDPFPAAAITLLSERHDLELVYIQNIQKLRLVSGVSTRLDMVNAENVFKGGNTQKHRLHRTFAHGEYRFNDNWILNTGLMIENNDISGTDVSPRLSVIHHINDINTLRLGISKATRTPTLYDQNAFLKINQRLTQDGGNPLSPAVQAILGGTDILNLINITSPGNVDSEEISSIELGVFSQLINRKLNLDMKFFKDSTDQLIGRTDQPQPNAEDNFDGLAHQIINTAKTISKGMEISLDYKQPRNFRIYAHYAYIDIKAMQFNPLGNTSTPRRLEISAPTNTYGFLFTKHWPKKLDTSISFYRVGKMEWSDRTRTVNFFNDRSAQAYDKVDINISKTYNIGKESLKISLILQNLAEDFFDYNKTKYTDASLSTIAPPSKTISSFGSLQDRRTYIEVSFLFN